MRLLLTGNSKKQLHLFLKKYTNSKTLKDLSNKMNVPVSTLENYFYNRTRYIPHKIIPKKIRPELEILDEQQDNWGKKKGGKNAYSAIIKKYGKEEIERRQKEASRVSALNRDLKAKENLKIDIESPLFLEFYGALLGDGWLSSLSYRYKTKTNLWWIGISGHAKLDKEYLIFLRDIMKKLFKRKAMIKHKRKSNAIEIILCHKQLILFMNKAMGFPIGKKNDLKIQDKITEDWEKMRHVIRGVFDTDGSLYFDKDSQKRPNPIISIHMKAPKLLDQIYEHLIKQGFRVRYRKYEIILKGSKQLNKWMEEIGSSNPEHYNKYRLWTQRVPVAQSG